MSIIREIYLQDSPYRVLRDDYELIEKQLRYKLKDKYTEFCEGLTSDMKNNQIFKLYLKLTNQKLIRREYLHAFINIALYG